MQKCASTKLNGYGLLLHVLTVNATVDWLQVGFSCHYREIILVLC